MPACEAGAGWGGRNAEGGVGAIRGIYFAFGILFTALGFIGIFLPVLPTVPFLIAAVACFARSSPRMERWLMSHPIFGPMLRDWRERGAIPMKGKLFALVGCVTGFAMFVYLSQPPPWLIATVAVLMIGALAYVFTRPSA